MSMKLPAKKKLSVAVFGSGCFWCSEAIYSELIGVSEVISGYAGGNVVSPSYEQVCTGTTKHAEVVQIFFDEKQITYVDLLRIFFSTHDPTTPNRQGNDIGSQYRSVIFYTSENQKKTAFNIRNEIAQLGLWHSPIVTEILPLKEFYPAELFHKNYFDNNPDSVYCQVVIAPKLQKFRKAYLTRLKKGKES